MPRVVAGELDRAKRSIDGFLDGLQVVLAIESDQEFLFELEKLLRQPIAQPADAQLVHAE